MANQANVFPILNDLGKLSAVVNKLKGNDKIPQELIDLLKKLILMLQQNFALTNDAGNQQVSAGDTTVQPNAGKAGRIFIDTTLNTLNADMGDGTYKSVALT